MNLLKILEKNVVSIIRIGATDLFPGPHSLANRRTPIDTLSYRQLVVAFGFVDEYYSGYSSSSMGWSGSVSMSSSAGSTTFVLGVEEWFVNYTEERFTKGQGTSKIDNDKLRLSNIVSSLNSA